MAGAAILVDGLEKVYRTTKGDRIHALAEISFSVAEGEFVAVVGPSGCGKSTLLKILGGILSKTRGQVILKGTPVDGPRRDIGFVFQNPVLLPWRTVLQNTVLPAQVMGMNMGKVTARGRELLKMVALEGFEDKYPFELSGGMQQRNSIARALLHDPSILLMDEPFGALDAMTREQMNLELLRIWGEARKTVIFVTHSISEAVFLADRVVILSSRPGRIIDVVASPLPRPRPLEMMGSPEFGAATREIRERLRLRGNMD